MSRKAQRCGWVLAGLMVLAVAQAGAQVPKKRQAWLELLYRAPQIVEKMRITPGSRVAVFGLSDTGFLRHVFARVGPEGVVFTVDRFRERFVRFVEIAGPEFGDRLRPIYALDGDAHLEPGQIDVVLIIDRDGTLSPNSWVYPQAAEALPPGGHLMVLRLRDQELSEEAARPARPGGRDAHARQLDANRNIILVVREGFELVEEDLEMLSLRSLRVYRRKGGAEAPVSSTPGGPPPGSALRQDGPSPAPGRGGP